MGDSGCWKLIVVGLMTILLMIGCGAGTAWLSDFRCLNHHTREDDSRRGRAVALIFLILGAGGGRSSIAKVKSRLPWESAVVMLTDSISLPQRAFSAIRRANFSPCSPKMLMETVRPSRVALWVYTVVSSGSTEGSQGEWDDLDLSLTRSVEREAERTPLDGYAYSATNHI